MTPLLNASRFLVLAAVLGSLLSALTLYAYGLVDTVAVILRTLAAGDVSTTDAPDGSTGGLSVEGGGCGCRAPGSSSRDGLPLALVAAAIAAVSARRRRR